MKSISSIITETIEKTMEEKGLKVFTTAEGKCLALDGDFNTRYKFDLIFTDNDFSCRLLKQGNKELVISKTFNIPWTNGEGIREFFDCLRSL